MLNVQPIGMGDNTVYRIQWRLGAILVDAGPDYRGAWRQLQEALDGGRPDAVMVTHGHIDHAGLGAAWSAEGVPVALGRDDHELVASPLLHRPGELEAMTGYLREAGVSVPTARVMATALRERHRRAAPAAKGEYGRTTRPGHPGLAFRPFKAAPSDSVELPPGMEVLACPGHTPGNLVLVERNRGWLFSGDQLLRSFAPTPAIQPVPGSSGGAGWRFRSLPRYVESLRQLSTLALRRCFPGHGDPFDDAGSVIARNLGAIEARTARVSASLREGGPASAWELCERLYRRVAGRRAWQVLATIQGHLDLLEEAGEASWQEGRWRASDVNR